MLRPTRSRSLTGPAGGLAYAGRGQHKVLLLAMHYAEGAVEPDTLRIQSLLDHCSAAIFSVAQQEATRVGYTAGNISRRIPFCETLDPHVIALDYFWQQAEYYRRADRYHNNVRLHTCTHHARMHACTATARGPLAHTAAAGSAAQWFDGKIQQCFSDAHSLRAFLIPYNNEGDVERMKRGSVVGFRSFDMTLEDARRLHPLFVATQLIDRELRGYSDRGASGGTFQGRFNEAQCRWLAEPAFACVYREGDTEEAVRDFLSSVVGVEAVKLLAEVEATEAAALRPAATSQPPASLDTRSQPIPSASENLPPQQSAPTVASGAQQPKKKRRRGATDPPRPRSCSA